MRAPSAVPIFCCAALEKKTLHTVKPRSITPVGSSFLKHARTRSQYLYIPLFLCSLALSLSLSLPLCLSFFCSLQGPSGILLLHARVFSESVFGLNASAWCFAICLPLATATTYNKQYYRRCSNAGACRARQQHARTHKDPPGPFIQRCPGQASWKRCNGRAGVSCCHTEGAPKNYIVVKSKAKKKCLTAARQPTGSGNGAALSLEVGTLAAQQLLQS